jgi:hypothetical protein
MNSVILAKDFDIKHIKLGALRTLDNGGKVVYVNYKGSPLIIQTPKLKAPFGLSNWEGKYSVDLSLSGYDGSIEGVTTFFNVLSQLDEQMLEQGMANGMAWFKRKMASTDVVDALYTRNVKFPKDRNTGEITDKYPPTFKLSIPTRDGKFQVDAYDVKKEKIDISSVELKGAKITALAQCLGLWVAGGKFGCSWKVIQLRVEPLESIQGYAFHDMDESQKEESDIDGNDDDADEADDKEEQVASSDADDDVDASNAEDATANDELDEDDELECVATASAASGGKGCAPKKTRARKAAA